jgi:hypothetical protein
MQCLAWRPPRKPRPRVFIAWALGGDATRRHRGATLSPACWPAPLVSLCCLPPRRSTPRYGPLASCSVRARSPVFAPTVRRPLRLLWQGRSLRCDIVAHPQLIDGHEMIPALNPRPRQNSSGHRLAPRQLQHDSAFTRPRLERTCIDLDGLDGPGVLRNWRLPLFSSHPQRHPAHHEHDPEYTGDDQLASLYGCAS